MFTTLMMSLARRRPALTGSEGSAFPPPRTSGTSRSPADDAGQRFTLPPRNLTGGAQ